MSLEQLRRPMPELRRQDQADQAELQSLETAAADQTKYLRLVETLGSFRGRLRARADTLDVLERQKILRLLVKEVLVGRDTITVRHSIRISTPGPVHGEFIRLCGDWGLVQPSTVPPPSIRIETYR